MKIPCDGKTLVVQVGEAEIQVASLVLGGKEPQLQECAIIPIPAGAVVDGAIQNLPALREALSALCRQNRFRKAGRVIFVLVSAQVISQVVELPAVKSGRKLAQILETNADLYFPVETGAYQLTWQVMGRREMEGVPQTQVQLWGAPKGLLVPYYQLARDCGLHVAAIDYCGHSFARSIRASFTSAGSLPGRRRETILYVHLEGAHILLSFVEQGRVLLQRLLRRSGTLQADLNDVFMEMEYFHAEFPANVLEKWVVSGSGAEEETFITALKELADLPLRQLGGEEEQRWCLCLGASQTELDFGDSALDPRGGNRRRLLLQPVLLGIAALLLAGAAGLYLTASRAWEQELQTLREEYLLLDEEAAGVAGFAESYRQYAAEYQAYTEDWETLFRSIRTYNDNACLVLEEVERVLPRDAALTSLALDEQSLTADVVFQTKEDAASFLIGLRDLRYAALLSVSDLQALAETSPEVVSALQELYTPTVAVSRAPTAGATALSEPFALTVQDLKEGLARLETEEEFALLDGRYAALYDEWAWGSLMMEATPEQRQAAVSRLLQEDVFACRWFCLLARVEEQPENSGQLLATWETVEVAEDLLKDHYFLRRKLAEMLVVELGHKAAYEGHLDFQQLRADILSGKTKKDAALDAVVRKLLPPNLLDDYDGMQRANSAASGGAQLQQTVAVPVIRKVAREPEGNYGLTVMLAYKEALIQASQAREGLDETSMLADLVEVTG